MKKSVLLLFIIPLLSFSLHKYYVSLTEIVYNSASESVEIITNVFVDDFEVALNNDFKIDAKLNTPQQLKNSANYIVKYLEKHLKITINNQPKKYTFIGKEYEADIMYFYLEIKNVKNFDTIKIENSILTQYFKDQQNLVKVKVGKKIKSLFLTKKNDKGLLNF